MNTYFQQELADVAVCTKAKLWLAKRYVKAPHEHEVIGGQEYTGEMLFLVVGVLKVTGMSFLNLLELYIFFKLWVVVKNEKYFLDNFSKTAG